MCEQDRIRQLEAEIERLAALAQSDVERNIEELKADGWRLPINAARALAQSDAEPTVKMDWSLSEESKRQLEEIERATVRPGDARLNIIVGAQSDAKPALPQTLRDAAENLLIAIGMGWDIEGCVENLRAALAQSDAEPVAVKTQFEEWAFTKGHRNFTKLGEGYLLPEIQKDWLAFHTQSDAEPVAWQNERAVGMREAVHIMHAANLSSAELRLIDKHCDWQAFKHAFNAVMKARASRVLASVDAIETERAYTAPPRPDASAGLIEAAEIAEAIVERGADENDNDREPAYYSGFIYGAEAVAKALRARAADRSGK